ncbi:MAG: Flp pilus assembly complex ATPase component TadA [Candidatus Marinimicrobia bacterium]|nr:Flp pilus assembly complex ATPase component TadA [Candidatus Neomarinimicrobiota bacterium]MCF7880567.1 Flp pilus assembly complex ATPase component TadA [Candidatus Neomarinimicrobiota bacterium]
MNNTIQQQKIPDISDIIGRTKKLTSEISDHVSGAELQEQIGQIYLAQPETFRSSLRRFLHDSLRQMEPQDASDMDIGGPGCAGKIWYRIHGEKKPVSNNTPLPHITTDFLCQALLTGRQRALLLEGKNVDFSYSLPSLNGKASQRFRADMYFDLGHLALNVRRISSEIRPFKSLGFHPAVAQLLSVDYQSSGLILVTGISGAGKSSTLDTIIDANNRTANTHIVIIASPVELVHTPQKAIIRHREVGRDVRSFKSGTVEALRQDPDIIVIGELRDPETIITALEVADSGHKTFSTLHTASAIESIDRIVAETPPTEQDRVRHRLADVLTVVISQKLIRDKAGKPVLAKEVLVNNSSVRAAIQNNNTNDIYQILQEGSESGMHTLEQDLKRLVDQGTIEAKTAISHANNKKRMRQLLQYLD